MPINNIQTKEFGCGHCGYKWTNRIYGKDGPVPRFCAKCKRTNLNDPNKAFTPEEIGLRRKIKGFRGAYQYQKDMDWHYDLSDVFLQVMNPRPTYKQLKKIVNPFGDLKKWKWVPCPNRSGRFTRNPNMGEIRKNEAEELKRLMLDIMNERGIKYDVAYGIQIMQEYRSEVTEEFKNQFPDILAVMKEHYSIK